MPLIQDIIVICALALVVTVVCHRLTVPPIVGFLVTGVLAGPHGLGLVSQAPEVEELAEIGVVCLLFAIGVEFSLKSFLRIKFAALAGGSIQGLISVAALLLVAPALGLAWNSAVFWGFLLALSSTAIVLKLMSERAEIEAPHGRLSLAILVFQDLAVAPVMLMAPALAGTAGSLSSAVLTLLVKGAAVLFVVYASARWIVPAALHQVARLRSPELFMLVVALIGLGAAWGAARAGLSLALGAFLAGLIVSESEYSHRALGNVIPFRDLFSSFFFVSIGMLLDMNYVVREPFLIVFTAVGVVVIKTLATGAAAIVLGFPLRTAILGGLALSQIGEFSFVLSESGLRLGLIDAQYFQLFLAVSVLTMVATPFLMSNGRRIAALALTLPMPEILRSGFRPMESSEEGSRLNNHLIIVGFGLTGRNLSRAADAAGVPHVIIEMNPETVRKEAALGRRIFNGDAGGEAVLEHAGASRATVLVIVISDPVAARRIVDSARRLNPGLHIIARTRFFSEMGPLLELGADEVIPEDYEAATELLARTLRKYLVPRQEVEKLIGKFREDHYSMLRELRYESPTITDLQLQAPDFEISALRVCPECPVVGKSLSELDLRRNRGVTVVAIKRGSSLVANPHADERLAANDITMVLGAPEAVAEVAGLFGGFDGPGEPSPAEGSSD